MLGDYHDLSVFFSFSSGYLVWSGVQVDSSYGLVGFRVILQSAERSALYLETRIEHFIAGAEVRLVYFVIFFHQKSM